MYVQYMFCKRCIQFNFKKKLPKRGKSLKKLNLKRSINNTWNKSQNQGLKSVSRQQSFRYCLLWNEKAWWSWSYEWQKKAWSLKVRLKDVLPCVKIWTLSFFWWPSVRGLECNWSSKFGGRLNFHFWLGSKNVMEANEGKSF